MTVPTLNIIGAGRVGQTLGRLFNDQHCFKIQGIFNKNLTSAQKAVDFIQAGKPYSTLEELPASEVTMITTPDADIENIALLLQEKISLPRGSIIFHCSGALSSAALLSLSQAKIYVASIHPIMTFANPATAVGLFSGTYCAYEGNREAFNLLEAAFTKIGGNVLQIAADKKPLYHAAMVMACNNLVALMDIALQLFVDCGLTRSQASTVLQPLVEKTINNIFSIDTVNALTGPIARGDSDTIKRHIDAIEGSYAATAYRILGQRLIEISAQKGEAKVEQLEAIKKLLRS